MDKPDIYTEKSGDNETLPNNLKPVFQLDRETVELVKGLFEHIENQLARVDEKAELTITASAILVAATAISNPEAIASILDSSVPFLCRLTAFMQLLMLVTLLTSFYYSFRAVIPRLYPTKRPMNLFDFSYIVQLNEEEFAQRFMGQEDRELYTSLLSEIHTLCRIATSKYSLLRSSFIYLLTAFVLWAISQLTAHTCLP